MTVESRKNFIVGVVGPCGAGKTTLCAGLKSMGLSAKHIAQEHSYVKDMWKRLSKPDILIYLDVSYPLTLQRRRIDWSLEEYNEQLDRLSHARQSADLYLNTDNLSPPEVLAQVLDILRQVNT